MWNIEWKNKIKKIIVMNKNTFTTVNLGKGEMNIYDFGGIRLHAYKTNDFIDDEVFIIEKGGKAVVIESPCFFDNNSELARYLENMQVEGMLIAYHGAGASFLPEVPKYATQNAVDYSQNGGGKELVDKFTGASGEAFDSSIHKITNIINEGLDSYISDMYSGGFYPYDTLEEYWAWWSRHIFINRYNVPAAGNISYICHYNKNQMLCTCTKLENPYNLATSVSCILYGLK